MRKILFSGALILAACSSSGGVTDNMGGDSGNGSGGASSSSGGTSASGGAASGGAASGGAASGGAASGGAGSGGDVGTGGETSGSGGDTSSGGDAGSGGNSSGGSSSGGNGNGSGGASSGGSGGTGGDSGSGGDTSSGGDSGSGGDTSGSGGDTSSGGSDGSGGETSSGGANGSGGGSSVGGERTFELNRVILGSTTTTGSALVSWDETNLTVAFAIQDATPHNDSGNYFEDDGVEIYIDLDNGKSGSMQPGDYQINAKVGSSSVNGTGGATWSAIGVAQSNVSGGYTITVTVPWTALGTTGAAMLGETVGFDLAVNDDKDGGTRDAQLMWWGGEFNFIDPSLWGELTLD